MEEIWRKIQEGQQALAIGKQVVICCDYGVSRSNSVATGILAVSENLSFGKALRRVLDNTGEKEIKIETLNAVRQAVERFRPDLIDRNQETEINILLTGSSGYLGTPLSAMLSDRFQLELPGRKELNLLEGPIELDCLVKEKGITHILHLANPREFGKNQSLGEALLMLKNILDVCKQNSTKLVFLSSLEVFSGHRSDRLLAAESLPAYPVGAVGETKFLCEKILNLYEKLHGLEYVNIRSSLVYGGAGTRPKFLFNFIATALRDETIIVHKYRNGCPVIDLLHIEDFSLALSEILDKDPVGTFHIGSGSGYTTEEIAKMVCEAVGSKSAVGYRNIDEFAPNVVMDISTISSQIGWLPQISLKSGIKSMAERISEAGTQLLFIEKDLVDVSEE
jgi:UDP-glucuronate decarboxylase